MTLSLKVNEDLKSRVTYSVVMKKLIPEDAPALIVRSADGFLRRARNLCLSSMLEAVRDRKKTADIQIVNRVLIQPHWRVDFEPEKP